MFLAALNGANKKQEKSFKLHAYAFKNNTFRLVVYYSIVVSEITCLFDN